jgi:hypothetical protein
VPSVLRVSHPTETAIQRNPILPDRLRTVAAWALAVMAWTGACSDESAITGTDDGSSPLIVSDPALSVALPGGGFAVVLASAGRDSLSLAAGGAAFARVAFISLPSGTVPTGTDATIRNARTGRTAVAQIVAGGLDPVGVEALESDVVELEVRRANTQTPVRFAHMVPVNRRPKVVRTNPPRGKRDVALNSRISIIFSEPIDDRTLVSMPIQVLRGTIPVAGRLEFDDVDHITAAFVPNEALALGTDYQLVVNQDVHDLDGEALEAPLTTEFTTTADAPPPTRLRFTVEPTTTMAGVPITPPVRVAAEDELGNVVPGFAGVVTIVLSTNPGGATLRGTTSAEVVNGIATFTGLVLDRAGTGYRLEAAIQALSLAAISSTFDVTALSADVAYFNAFEAPVGPEWSHSQRTGLTDESRAGPGLLGDFGCTDYEETTPRQADNCRAADLVTLTLAGLPEHAELTITFDLYLISTWDGNAGLWAGDEGIAPDVFNLSVEGGPTLLNASFAVHPSRLYQSYPAPYPTDGSTPPNNDRNAGALEDGAYRLTFTFTHSEPTVTFKFTAPKLQELWDESWGLDNVEVRAKTPSP